MQGYNRISHRVVRNSPENLSGGSYGQLRATKQASIDRSDVFGIHDQTRCTFFSQSLQSPSNKQSDIIYKSKRHIQQHYASKMSKSKGLSDSGVMQIHKGGMPQKKMFEMPNLNFIGRQLPMKGD